MKGILEKAEAIKTQIIADRENLHQMPEVGVYTPNTAAYVKQRLTELGIKHKDCGVHTEQEREKNAEDGLRRRAKINRCCRDHRQRQSVHIASGGYGMVCRWKKQQVLHLRQKITMRIHAAMMPMQPCFWGQQKFSKIWKANFRVQ